jgi:hypothetical protein
MSRLSFDIARCEGVSHIEDGKRYWREGCEDCLRRTAPGRQGAWGQVYMAPPKVIAFECESRIAPEGAE